MPDFRQLHDEEIHALYAELASQYEIPALNRDDPSIKYGLRNADGTGVIAGVSNIGSVQGYYMEDGVRQPMPGKLYYRGISVEDIVEAHQKAGTFGYEEVAYLLLIGHLPTRDQLQKFNLLLEQARFLPERFQEDNVLHNPSNNVMNQLARCVTDLYAYDDNADDTSMENLTRQSIELIARFPLIAANAYQAKRHYIDGKSLYVHNPKPGLSLAENYLRMLRKDKRYSVEEARLLDLMMILHAEHSSNNSTFVCRAISSSGTDTYSAIAGAIGALKSPLHGGASAKPMERFRAVRGELGATPSDAALGDCLDRLLDGSAGDGSGKIYGLGHAVYTMSDPRAVVITHYAMSLAEQKGRADDLILMERIEQMGIEKIMARRSRRIAMCANIDMYSGLIYDMLGLPEDMYTPLFASARMAGWCAHRTEELATGKRIMRPAYRAAQIRAPYIPVEER